MNNQLEITIIRMKLILSVAMGIVVSYIFITQFFNSYCGLSILMSRFSFNSILLGGLFYYLRDKFFYNKLSLPEETEIYGLFFLIGAVCFLQFTNY